MSQKVTKAVIAAAGFGTRFLPQTKAMPKEMLPIVDKPIIQYIVEELVSVGVQDIIIVTNAQKRAIEDHFDVPTAELTDTLENGGKEETLERLRNIANMANFVYVRQKKSLGNAAPLLYAGHLINDEPFIYTWGDDFINATPSRFQQMIDTYNETGGSVISCIRLDKDEDYDRYGVVAGQETQPGRIKMSSIVEKPGRANAPSNMGSVSSYLFTPEITHYLEETYQEFSGEGELNIQTAMQAMIDQGHAYYGVEIKNSKYHDAGNKLEYLKTVIDFGLEHPELGGPLRDFLRQRL